MGLIKGIIEDEHSRLIEALKLYENKRDKLPKGSLIIRRFGKKEYIYRVKRENGKVVQTYIGKKDSEAHKQAILEKMRREMEEKQIKIIKEDLRNIEKIKKVKYE
jgi:hypothetical protein